MLVDEIARVPLEVEILVGCLRLAISVERLVRHYINVEIVGRLETFAFHPLTTVASEGDAVARDSAQVLDNFGADKVGLARVCQQAD